MKRIFLLVGALAGLSACSTHTIRLYELRDADPGTPRAAAYQRLAAAVDLANRFLSTSRYAPVFPAEGADFRLGFTDVLVHFHGEGFEALRIENTGWADPRAVSGDDDHPTASGFYTARLTGPAATGDDTLDAGFLHLPAVEMAAVLLRQAAMMREVNARGEFDFWMNHNLLGLWPGNGWGEDNPVTLRAYATEEAFRMWLDESRVHSRITE